MPEKKLKIGFISSAPLEDKRNWSGSMFSIYQSLLKKGYDIVHIKTPVFSSFERKLFIFIENFYQKLFNRGFNTHHFITKSVLASRKIKKQVEGENIDILFAPTTISEIAFLNIGQPIVYLNDANVNQLLNYYSYYSGFGWLSKKITHYIEKRALHQSHTIIYSSEWAAKDAENFYKIPKSKINVVKFGANSEVPDKINLNKDYTHEIVFLFLAVLWERKGGDLALKTIELLRKKGYRVKLQVVGCNPNVKSDSMEVIPFLNKNIPEEAQKIKDFLNNAHFLFIPTKADCTPISFCEAAGYGLPVITSNTGGIADLVEDGITGFTLPENATPEDYALRIEQLLNNHTLIQTMSANARKKYERELNWEIWAEKTDEILSRIFPNPKI